MARRVSDKYVARFLKVDDLNGKPLSLTVTRVADEEVGEEKKDMYVAYFKETPKGFPLNHVNGEAIADFLGTDDVDRWVGAVITLIPAKTTFGGKRVPCIRVKSASLPPGRTVGLAEEHPHELEDEDDGESSAVQ